MAFSKLLLPESLKEFSKIVQPKLLAFSFPALSQESWTSLFSWECVKIFSRVLQPDFEIFAEAFLKESQTEYLKVG